MLHASERTRPPLSSGAGPDRRDLPVPLSPAHQRLDLQTRLKVTGFKFCPGYCWIGALSECRPRWFPARDLALLALTCNKLATNLQQHARNSAELGCDFRSVESQRSALLVEFVYLDTVTALWCLPHDSFAPGSGIARYRNKLILGQHRRHYLRYLLAAS